MSKQPLKEQHIVITGPENEIGHHLCKHLASMGAQLILPARKAKYLYDLHDDIEESGYSPPIIIEFDRYRASEAGFSQFAEQLCNHFDCLQGIIHCELNSHALTPVMNTTFNQWQDCYRDYFHIPFALTHCLLPLLKKSIDQGRTGHCIATLRQDATSGEAFFGPVGAAQSALLHLQKTLKNELADTGLHFDNVFIDDIRCAQQRHFYPGLDLSNLYAPDSEHVLHRFSNILLQK